MKNVKNTTDILHHIGLINASLEQSAACYEQLGFTLTPLSIPRVALTPGGAPESLGAGNRHAIFSDNYLELLGVVDQERWSKISKEQRGPYDLDAPLSRYEGLHVMHFGTDHIEAVKARLDHQGVPCSDIKVFRRNVQTESGEQMMQARTIHFPARDNPEGLIQVAQHDTPELVFQDQYRRHRNGATALTEIMLVTEAPDLYAAKYEEYSGHRSTRIARDHYVLDLGRSGIRIVNPEGLLAIIPGCTIPTLPFMAAFTVEVTDLELVYEVLWTNSIPFTKKPGVVLVYPEHACGCTVIFEERKQDRSKQQAIPHHYHSIQ